MRTIIAAAFVLAGCSQRSTPEEYETGAFDPHEAIHESDDALRVEVHRRDVPLQDMPIIAQVLGGLPMAGLADVSIDLSVPKPSSVARYREATGTIDVSCARGCALGDKHAQLTARGLPPLDFGQLVIDKLAARVDIRDGRVDLARWELVSKDLAMGARLRIDLADSIDASTIDGCVWFKPDPSLAQREPKTAAVLMTTGATADADGFFEIKLGGTIGARKLLAQQCR